MKSTKQNVIAQVQSSVSSIFSKEDVLFLINSIEEASSNKVTAQDIERAIDKTISWLENNEREFLDLDSAELEMRSKKIDFNKEILVNLQQYHPSQVYSNGYYPRVLINHKNKTVEIEVKESWLLKDKTSTIK
jgi:hypothetical protein